MRITTLLKRLLAVTSLVVDEVDLAPDRLVVKVRPRWRRPRCSVCSRRGRGYDRRPPRRWKHLAFGSMYVWLEYAPRRVECRRCGIRVEQVPWGDAHSRFTYALEEMVAYLATVTSQSTVCDMVGIDWRTVGSIVDRIVHRRLDPARFKGLRNIGVDEFSYRKHHRYLTIVVDHDQRRVIWAGVGRSGKTLHEFFDQIGEEVAAGIENVTMDMAAGYISVVEQRIPQAQIVFDRFHVAQLASAAVDEVRREIVREMKGTDQARALKGSRWALLTRPHNRSRKHRQRLSEIQKSNEPLYRASLLNDSLARILDYRQPRRAARAFDQWLAWAARSRLRPFVKLARTLRKYRDRILSYIGLRLTNGLAEGMNNKIRVIARRAYGFHCPYALMSFVFLCCGGIPIDPPLPGNHPHYVQ